MQSDFPAQIGEVIGAYRLDEVIGAGGMGCVFAATHARLGRKAAVKVLASRLACEAEYVSRFFHEARIVNEVRHPNIVDIMDFLEFESPRRVAYVMELISGPSLGAVLKKGPLSTTQAINVALQLSGALEAVHAVHVIHRDLKPDNILVVGSLEGDLSESPSVKVLDFGIAKSADPDAAHKTATGSMLGTPAYMAPEQVAGEKVTPAADVYALGEILYEMLAGARIFRGDQGAMLRAKLIGELPPLEFPDGAGRPRFESLVRACLASEPAVRPDLHTICGELTQALVDHTSSSRSGASRRPPSQSRLERAALAEPSLHTPMNLSSVALPTPPPTQAQLPMFAGIVALAVALVAGGLWWLSSDPKAPQPVIEAPIAQPLATQPPAVVQPPAVAAPTKAPEPPVPVSTPDEGRSRPPARKIMTPPSPRRLKDRDAKPAVPGADSRKSEASQKSESRKSPLKKRELVPW